LLFVDEIHRFNRAQQDGFLPYVEDGTVTLIGATTENPSFELNGALLSRCQVLVLRRLDDAALSALLARVEQALARKLPIDEEGRQALFAMADGDGRYLIGLAEQLAQLKDKEPVPPARLATLLQKRAPLYDKAQEAHYNLISALHKSVRDSDPDATLYWLARMLEAGEDRLFVARRLVRMASEDIGLADPHALAITLAAKDAYDFLGTPEGELALAEAAVYLACAPKSNAVYTAFDRARADVHARPAEPVPHHLRNAPTRLMTDLGYGAGYQYAHDAPDAIVAQEHLPAALRGRTYYHPVPRGFEQDIRARLERWRTDLRRRKAEEAQ
jgi:putative ATPase